MTALWSAPHRGDNLFASVQSLKVGILDADVFGPSLPRLMNLEDQDTPALTDNKRMVPLVNYGIKWYAQFSQERMYINITTHTRMHIHTRTHIHAHTRMHQHEQVHRGQAARQHVVVGTAPAFVATSSCRVPPSFPLVGGELACPWGSL